MVYALPVGRYGFTRVVAVSKASVATLMLWCDDTMTIFLMGLGVQDTGRLVQEHRGRFALAVIPPEMSPSQRGDPPDLNAAADAGHERAAGLLTSLLIDINQANAAKRVAREALEPKPLESPPPAAPQEIRVVASRLRIRGREFDSKIALKSRKPVVELRYFAISSTRWLSAGIRHFPGL